MEAKAERRGLAARVVGLGSDWREIEGREEEPSGWREELD